MHDGFCPVVGPGRARGSIRDCTRVSEREGGVACRDQCPFNLEPAVKRDSPAHTRRRREGEHAFMRFSPSNKESSVEILRARESGRVSERKPDRKTLVKRARRGQVNGDGRPSLPSAVKLSAERTTSLAPIMSPTCIFVFPFYAPVVKRGRLVLIYVRIVRL